MIIDIRIINFQFMHICELWCNKWDSITIIISFCQTAHFRIKMTHISQDEKISNGGLVLENLSDMEWNIAGNYI